MLAGGGLLRAGSAGRQVMALRGWCPRGGLGLLLAGGPPYRRGKSTRGAHGLGRPAPLSRFRGAGPGSNERKTRGLGRREKNLNQRLKRLQASALVFGPCARLREVRPTCAQDGAQPGATERRSRCDPSEGRWRVRRNGPPCCETARFPTRPADEGPPQIVASAAGAGMTRHGGEES